MLNHVYIQAISDVFSDLKLATNTHVTHMHTYVQLIPVIIYDFYDLFPPYFLRTRHPSSYVSTHQQHILPVQITGRRVVIRADKYCQDVLDHEHLGHVKGHKLWICEDTRGPCGILRLPVCRRVQFLKHDLIQICDLCFIHHVISRVVNHGIATKYLGI